jgi:hypothetical protein
VKKRYWAMLAVGVILFILVGRLDWPELNTGQETDQVTQPTPTSSTQALLRACEAAGAGDLGPLVPDQEAPASDAQVETLPAEAIPQIAWSARAGFSISSSTDPTHWAQMLGAGWYLDWRMQGEIPANGPEHWQMVRLHEDCISPSPERVQSTAASYPGSVWIIGNEPDVIWQDNVTPASYAATYHALYQLIKASDPSAQVAVGGISQATPLRLQYLDQVLETYQELYGQPLPADWWTVHGYVLREQQDSWGVEIPPGIDTTEGALYEVSDHGRLDLFENQLVAFRQWMKANGYQATPLALTEFGILMPASYGFPPDTIADYLEQSFTWLYAAEDPQTGDPADSFHLVQKWAWFSISDPNYPSANLGDLASGELSLVGERFRALVSEKGQ